MISRVYFLSKKAIVFSPLQVRFCSTWSLFDFFELWFFDVSFVKIMGNKQKKILCLPVWGWVKKIPTTSTHFSHSSAYPISRHLQSACVFNTPQHARSFSHKVHFWLWVSGKPSSHHYPWSMWENWMTVILLLQFQV